MRFDDDFLRDPVSVLTHWREAGPVHRARTPDGAPVWVVTRYREARAALADPRLALNKVHSRTGYTGFSLPGSLERNLLNMDPPDHTRIRKLVVKAFTARRVNGMRPRIEAIADELADRLRTAADREGQVDLLSSFAAPLPIMVICELLGIPEERRADFRSWTNSMLAPARREDVPAAVAALQKYLLDLIADKRMNLGNDLLSGLIAVRDDEDDSRLSEDELVSLAFLLLFAGYENTANLLTSGVAALLTQNQWTRLREDPTLLPTAVEELLRFDPPPTLAFRRFATEDVVIGDVTIPAGDTVMVSITAAHRDPAAFDRPDTLDLGRRENPHLGFGHGMHYCLGAPLARIETEIGLAALLRRLPNLSLAVPDDQLRWRPSFRSRGLMALPVTLA